MKAWIRDLYGEEHEAEVIDAGMGTGVAVAGFGTALFVERADGWMGGLINAGSTHERIVREVAGHLEMEILPNASGEDRLVVCLEP